MPPTPITSAAVPCARIVHSRTENAASAALPDCALGLGAFTVGAGLAGLPALTGPRGEACGLFANKQLADRTAERLSR